MKKNMSVFVAITALGAGLFSGNNAFAQSDQANLKVALVAVTEIVVNSAQKDIDFIYGTPAAYQSGITKTNADHLQITSTVDFQVTVKAETELTGPGSITIPVSTISIQAAAGSIGATGTYPAITNLSTSPQPLITSGVTGGTSGGTALGKYDVTYVSSGGSNYVNKPIGFYTATVTYTLAAL